MKFQYKCTALMHVFNSVNILAHKVNLKRVSTLSRDSQICETSNFGAYYKEQ